MDTAPTTSQPPAATFYDNLDESLAEAWRLLVRSARDRRSPIHTLAIATVGLDGRPRVRTVVLRHADPVARRLRFHTDMRSGKVAELAQNPAIEVLAYDPGHKIQMRLTGIGIVHHRDDYAKAAWAASQAQSRLCYRQDLPPGTANSSPASALTPAAHDGEANFAAVEIAVESIDWLYLAVTGHRRARFTFGDAANSATWLAP